jgi:hypothetical protein
VDIRGLPREFGLLAFERDTDLVSVVGNSAANKLNLATIPDWSLDPDDLGLAGAGLNDIGHAFTEHQSRQRRDLTDRALGWIGFILTNDPERLLPAIVAYDGHRRAEPHLGVVGRADTTRAVARRADRRSRPAVAIAARSADACATARFPSAPFQPAAVATGGTCQIDQ